MRYNCADSLDRTNAASYFAAVQVPACLLLLFVCVQVCLLEPLFFQPPSPKMMTRHNVIPLA